MCSWISFRRKLIKFQGYDLRLHCKATPNPWGKTAQRPGWCQCCRVVLPECTDAWIFLQLCVGGDYLICRVIPKGHVHQLDLE
jgi:hypothetical protein